VSGVQIPMQPPLGDTMIRILLNYTVVVAIKMLLFFPMVVLVIWVELAGGDGGEITGNFMEWAL